MTVEIIQAIGDYIVSPLAAAVVIGYFIHLVYKS